MIIGIDKKIIFVVVISLMLITSIFFFALNDDEVIHPEITLYEAPEVIHASQYSNNITIDGHISENEWNSSLVTEVHFNVTNSESTRFQYSFLNNDSYLFILLRINTKGGISLCFDSFNDNDLTNDSEWRLNFDIDDYSWALFDVARDPITGEIVRNQTTGEYMATWGNVYSKSPPNIVDSFASRYEKGWQTFELSLKIENSDLQFNENKSIGLNVLLPNCQFTELLGSPVGDASDFTDLYLFQ